MSYKKSVLVTGGAAGIGACIVSKCGQLDALVNNAGVLGQFGPIGEQSIDEWKRVMSINLGDSANQSSRA